MAENRKLTVNGMTQGVIWKQILLFFLPILGGSFLQQLYNTADAVIVGKFVGTAALSAVGGTTGLILNLVIGFFIGFTSGATVLVSQYFGAGREAQVNRTVHTAIAVSLIGGAVLTAVGMLAAPGLLRILQTPEDVVANAAPYLRICFGGTLATLFYNLGSSVLRAVGDSRRPLLVLACCTGANVALDLLFVAALDMGTSGAALATVLSQLLSAVLVMWMVHKKSAALRIDPKKLRLHSDILRSILRIGLPTGIQAILYTLSNLTIQRGVNAFGTDTIAAWTVFTKMDAIFWMIMDSFGVAVTTFIGQNFGAMRTDRVKQGLRQCAVMCLALAVGLTALIFAFCPLLARLFSNDAFVVARAVKIARFQVLFFVTWVTIQVLSSALRAVGDSFVPMVLISIGVCGLRMVWVLWIAPHLPRVLEYTICCYQISWAFTSLLFLAYYFFASPLRRQILLAEAQAGRKF